MHEHSIQQWFLSVLVLFFCFLIWIPVKAEQQGFVTTEGGTYYYDESGQVHTGWLRHDGSYYLFDDSGRMVTGWKTRGGATYYFRPSGIMAIGGLNIDGKAYAFSEGGILLNGSGWIRIAGQTYLFEDNGMYLVTGWKTRGGATYYFSYNGAMYTGSHSIDDKVYYFSQGGILQTGSGWLREGKNVYLFDSDGQSLVTGWRTRGGSTYFFDEQGHMVTGPFQIDGKVYYFSAGGMLQEGNNWISDENGTYLYNTSNTLTTGWRERGGARYYFSENGKMSTGPTRIEDKVYYFSAGGILRTQPGWFKDTDGNYYLINSDATLTTGWRVRGGATYFFDEYGRMATYNTKIGDKAYYFTAGGILYFGSGWYKDDFGKIFLFASDGSLTTGWRERGGSTYYFSDDGVMMTGVQVIDGKEYYFTPGGQLAAKDPMVTKAQGYSSDTQYLIMVDVTRHMVGVFEGGKGNWRLLDMFPCGDGAPETPTPLGNFAVSSKHVFFDSGNARCWYATGFIDSWYLFHSILYYQESSPRTIMDPTVGAAVSHGCIRLQLPKCKWIYENVPLESAVIIYR